MFAFAVLGAVWHAAVMTVAAFFVFYAAAGSQRALRTFGNLLGAVLLVFAAATLGLGAVELWLPPQAGAISYSAGDRVWFRGPPPLFFACFPAPGAATTQTRVASPFPPPCPPPRDGTQVSPHPPGK